MWRMLGRSVGVGVVGAAVVDIAAVVAVLAAVGREPGRFS